MRNGMLRKGLICGIIFLFIGTNFISIFNSYYNPNLTVAKKDAKTINFDEHQGIQTRPLNTIKYSLLWDRLLDKIPSKIIKEINETSRQYRFNAYINISNEQQNNNLFYKKIPMIDKSISVYSEKQTDRGTNVSGLIMTNTWWNLSGSPYIVVGDVIINTGINLTLEPGVTIKFNGYYALISLYGRLIADGTPTNKITFTSNTVHAPNTWGNIFLQYSQTGCILDNCIIEYAGYGIYLYGTSLASITDCTIQYCGTGIEVEHSSASIQYNTIRYNTDFGIYCYFEDSNPDISFNTIQYNGKGIHLERTSTSTDITYNIITNNSQYGICVSNFPQLTGNIIAGNGINEITVAGTVSLDTVWPVSYSPCIVIGDIIVSATLTLEAGVTIKFNGNYQLDSLYGKLIADGTPTNKITFTSNTVQTPGAWGCIHFHYSQAGCILDNCVIEYAGYGIYLYGTSLASITDCTIQYCGTGINIQYASAIIQFNTIRNSTYQGLYSVSESTASIDHNNFINNSPNAYDSASSSWDNGFEGNYWDDYTGEDNNGDGIGDTPYSIPGGNNKDNYPLMNPFDGENQPPDIPEKPSGPTTGSTTFPYSYSTKAIDPEDDQIYYNFSWGDNEFSNWLGPFDSGVTVEASHIWKLDDVYLVKVKVKDNYNHESDWSESLTVTIDSGEPVYRGAFFGIPSDVPGDKDAEKLSRTLYTMSHNWLLENNMRIFTTSQNSEDNYTESMNWLAENTDSNDVSLFFFSGHGTYLNNICWIKFGVFDIYSNRLAEDASKIGGLLIVIINSCGSGGFLPTLSSENRVVLTACNADEDTLAPRYFPQIGSIFVFYMTLGLKKIFKYALADKNSDGVVSIEELYMFTSTHMRLLGSDFWLFRLLGIGPQTPIMSDGNPDLGLTLAEIK